MIKDISMVSVPNGCRCASSGDDDGGGVGEEGGGSSVPVSSCK
jgi:hypothetical protein